METDPAVTSPSPGAPAPSSSAPSTPPAPGAPASPVASAAGAPLGTGELRALGAIVGAQHVLTADATAGYAVDWTGRFRGATRP